MALVQVPCQLLWPSGCAPGRDTLVARESRCQTSLHRGVLAGCRAGTGLFGWGVFATSQPTFMLVCIRNNDLMDNGTSLYVCMHV